MSETKWLQQKIAGRTSSGCNVNHFKLSTLDPEHVSRVRDGFWNGSELEGAIVILKQFSQEFSCWLPVLTRCKWSCYDWLWCLIRNAATELKIKTAVETGALGKANVFNCLIRKQKKKQLFCCMLSGQSGLSEEQGGTVVGKLKLNENSLEVQCCYTGECRGRAGRVCFGFGWFVFKSIRTQESFNFLTNSGL